MKRVRVRWTRLHQLWAAVAYPSFWSWLRDRGLAPQISLYGANLAGAYLAGWERGPDGYARRKEGK